jgi:hypothetical protein
VSARSLRPGPQSIVALHWLARLGAAPGEPLALVMKWSRPALYDHVARLERSGFVRRIAMTRGSGSLLVLTANGARMTGGPGASAPRSVAPTTWAHVSACAWVAAWFEVRGREWLSSREIARDNAWQGQVVCKDGYGRAQRQRHRPDLATYIRETGWPVAVEVELQPKTPARLRGILAMYEARTADPTPELAGVVYISSGARVTRPLRTAAAAVGLDEHPEGRLRVLELDDVIEQTRQAARTNRAQLADRRILRSRREP